jgi:hypothetical protein
VLKLGEVSVVCGKKREVGFTLSGSSSQFFVYIGVSVLVTSPETSESCV